MRPNVATIVAAPRANKFDKDLEIFLLLDENNLSVAFIAEYDIKC